jgi:glucose-1-phosphate cytidylyltransferase
MVEIGGKPILWHILKIYSHFGFNDFVICLGYRGYVIKEYFANYFLHMSDVTFDMRRNKMVTHQNKVEPWQVTLVDTGLDTMTGGRIKNVAPYLGREPFMVTYGDGLANVDIKSLLKFHKKSKKLVTVTAVQPPGRFGTLMLNSKDDVVAFREKPAGDGGWINGGFFVMEPQALKYIRDDRSVFEKEPLEDLAKDKQLNAYKHSGFWQPMDTLRDKIYLDQLWVQNKAPWKQWK